MIMISRANFLTLLGAAVLSSRADGAASGDEIFHVAIFRFAKEHVDDAMAAFRAIAPASRKDSGNLRYDVYRGTDDDLEFYIAEHWASQAAGSADETRDASRGGDGAPL